MAGMPAPTPRSSATSWVPSPVGLYGRVKQAETPAELLAFIDRMEKPPATAANARGLLKPGLAEHVPGQPGSTIDTVLAARLNQGWALESRRELFRQAVVLRSKCPELPVVPSFTHDANLDLSITLRQWCIDAQSIWGRRMVPSEADQAYGAAIGFVNNLNALASMARAFDRNARIFPPGSIGDLSDHEETRRKDGWPIVPLNWREWGWEYSLAFIDWFDLTLMPPSVRNLARRVYPPGTPPIRIRNSPPSTNYIEAVADQLGTHFRNILYAGRPHPLEPNPAEVLSAARACVEAHRKQHGPDSTPISVRDEYERLVAQESRVAIRQRLGLNTKSDVLEFLKKEWQDQDEKQVEWSVRTLRYDKIDLAELAVHLEREAHAVLRAEQETRQHDESPHRGPESPNTRVPTKDSSQRGEPDLGAAVPEPKVRPVEHASDYSWVRVDDVKFEFSWQAREVIKALFEAAENGDSGISVIELKRRVGSNADRFRVETCFRQKDGKTSRSFGVFVEKLKEGRVRLRPEVARKWRAE